MSKKLSLITSCAALTLASMPLLAQEDDTKLWSGEIEFGYSDTSGNTEESSTKSRIDTNRETETWLYNIHFDSLNSETNDERTAEKYFVSNRLGREYSDTDFIFAYASYEDDHFSGYDSQVTAALGWGKRLLDNEQKQWDIEVGPGYRINKIEDETTGEDTEEAILRFYTKYNWAFTETATFTQTLNVEAGSDNTITKSETALKLQIIGALALKLSYSIKYTDEVPTDTEHADTQTAVTVSYNF